MTVRPAILLAMVLVAVPLFCFGQSQNLDLPQIVSRMQQATVNERDRSVAYSVVREYQLSIEGAGPTAEVVAQVDFVPPSQKDYEIVKAEGSARGTGIVRKVLDHETQMASSWKKHQISDSNYDFALLGRETVDGRDCYVLKLTPKRETVELVDGKAWVDTQNFIIRRIDGVTAKSPSFWIKKLNVTINFGEVSGVWVETSTRAVAEVRLLGPHVLTSRELNVRTASVDAQAHVPPRARNRGHSHQLADTATWLPR